MTLFAAWEPGVTDPQTPTDWVCFGCVVVLLVALTARVAWGVFVHGSPSHD